MVESKINPGEDDTLSPSAPGNYSHSFRYAHGNEIIAFESGYYGLIVECKDLTSVRFKEFNPKDGITYLDCLQERHRERMEKGLVREDLLIELQMGNKSYIATHAEKPSRLWEAGKICQRYDFRGLHFEGLHNVDATLVVLVWPDSITFQVDIKLDDIGGRGGVEHQTNNGSSFLDEFTVSVRFKHWSTSQSFVPKDTPQQNEYSSILSCNLTDNLEKMLDPNSGVTLEVETKPTQTISSAFNKSFNCFLISANGDLKRPFLGGYRDIRDYDEFEVNILNKGSNIYVPVLLFVQPLANPTGVCPIVCDEDYNPTGIPIQLSKNWHLGNIPPYGRFFCYLPAKGTTLTTYRIRIVYGFYGTLPSASHANLSLVGYHNHGTRWEQLAIGCWGETYCMDIDMGCTKRTITDIRMLMTKGLDDLKWRWSDAGWGGDWATFIVEGMRLLPFHWKCAYLSHGPCLTEVLYTGWYGEEKRVYMSANVNTSRTDDYCRTITRIKYEFRGDLPAASDISFFQLGTAGYISTPTIAWGNFEGLVEERQLGEIPSGIYLSKKQMEGDGPWWFGFPGQRQLDERKWGKGWRALVIRKCDARFGGQQYNNPSFSLCNQQRTADDHEANITFMIQPPEAINEFIDGDWISFDIAVLTFPKNATDYYGPNEDFINHLQANTDSWKTIHREVIGNAMSILIHSGGEVTLNYPIIIAATNEDTVNFSIYGGIGAVPIKFTGLCSRNYLLYQQSDNDEVPLDQNVHTNDFWQAEFAYEHEYAEQLFGKYSLSFNIQLDSDLESTWILRKKILKRLL